MEIYDDVYSPRGIVAHVHEEVLAEWALATGTMTHAAANQMRGSPRDLSIVADLVQIVPFVVAEFIVLVLHVPHSDGESPGNEAVRFHWKMYVQLLNV